MSDNLRHGLLCPTCGERVVGVYHQWNTLTDTATFEYMHAQREGGFRRKPCVVQMSYDEGVERMRQETQA